MNDLQEHIKAIHQDHITFENIIEKVKRENSQWAVDDIYEFVILITPVPGILFVVRCKVLLGAKDRDIGTPSKVADDLTDGNVHSGDTGDEKGKGET